MVPLLSELAGRGHEVEVVVPPPFVGYVERVGLRATGLGPAWTEMAIDDVHPGWHDLREPGKHLRVWTEFATRFEPYLVRHVEATRPDVIVHDHMEFAAWLVGEQLDIPWVPYAMTVRTLDPTLIALSGATEAVEAMRASAGLPPDNGEGRGGHWLYLDAMPPSLTAELLPPGPTVHHVRHVADDRTGSDGVPTPMASSRSGRPLVYLTLGTIFNRADGIMQRLIDGAGRVDADVLVTVGENGRVPASVPDNVRIETYVPQESLYPSLSAVVCHAGFGTVFGAIAHGLPVGCAPIAADQRVNAGLISGAGAGVNLATTVPDGGLFPVLGEGEPDPALVAATIERLLDDVSLRERANELRTELRTGISQSDAADLVEKVVADRAPVLRR